MPKTIMGKKPTAAAIEAAEAKASVRRAAQAKQHEAEVAAFLANPPPIESPPKAPSLASLASAGQQQQVAKPAAAEQEEEEEEEEGGGQGGAAGGEGGGGSGAKLSRKARRQAHKAAQEAALDQLYALEQEFQKPSKATLAAREVENQALLEQLAPLGLRIITIPADGNCLYRALADQLQAAVQRAAGTAGEAAPQAAQASPDHRALRARAADFIRTYWEEYGPFLHYEPSDRYAEAERAGDLRSAVIRYCERMASSNCWGGHPELRALANVLACRLVVFRAGAKPLEFDPRGEERSLSGAAGGARHRQLSISFHAHACVAGEHYNSVRETYASQPF